MSAKTDPTPATAKKLFALSRSKCAFPGCGRPLVDRDVLVGELCHIKAASSNGPRYDKKQKPASRRAEENFIVLCPICHKVIDKNWPAYPHATLTQWKIEHERRTDDPPPPGSPEPSNEIAAELVRTASIGVLIDKLSVTSINQIGGIVAGNVGTIHYHEAAPAPVFAMPVPEPDPFDAVSISVPYGQWWCGIGEPIYTDRRHRHGYLASDDGARWGITMDTVDIRTGIQTPGKPGSLVWSHVKREFESVDSDLKLTAEELSSIRSRLVVASPLFRTDLTSVEQRTLDRICESVHNSFRQARGSTLRDEEGLAFDDFSGLRRLYPRLVERYDGPTDGYIAKVWGLLQSDRGSRAAEILTAVLGALRAHRKEFEHFSTFKWSFISEIRPDFDGRDRSMAALMMNGLMLTEVPVWNEQADKDGHIHLNHQWLEATQACKTPEDLWHFRRTGKIKGSWPTCPLRLGEGVAEP